MYQLTAETIMWDHRPDFAKLQRRGADIFGRRSDINRLTFSIQNLHTYIHLGWETGIYNEFRSLQLRGLTKAQCMEIVMYAQLTAGIRGLQHVYNAMAHVLPHFQDGAGPAPFPEGWAADPDAFTCGLDLSTRDLTDQDRTNLTDWYERTIGYVPRSVSFAATYHPEFLKQQRAKWEACFKTLPKQAAPYIMLRQHTITGFKEGLREAALLGKAWGITKEWIVQGITGTAYYYTGLEGLYAVDEALSDVLQHWDD